LRRNDVIRRQVRRAVEAALAERSGGSPPAAGGPAGGAGGPAGSPAGSPGTGAAIALGADHGSYRLKEALAGFLRERGWRVEDCGTHGTEAVDYPDFAHAVAERVASGACRWGIVVDGAGIGSAMVANKVPGVRAALCYDLSSARNSREHNHANVLTLGAGLIGEALARQIVAEWLATPWGPDRHARRVEKIDAVERRYLRTE
jgi:ribose 5-phosphate isomerase B